MSEKVSSGFPVNRILTFGAAAAAAPSVMETHNFASKIKTRKTGNGTHLLEGLRIFKAGTFKDSLGYEHTWETTHLEQMAFHFKLLRDGGNFPNVPIRVDHSFSARNVVGYFVDVYRAKDDDTFLAANIEITEPDAYEKWERGTYRSRSLEVGMYETNDGAAYWPVIMGLAFVDIPAVEGLHAAQRPGLHFSQVLRDEQEDNMGNENQGTGTEGAGTGTGTGDGGTTDDQGTGTGTDTGTGTGTGTEGGGTTGDQGTGTEGGGTAAGTGTGTEGAGTGGGTPAGGGGTADHGAGGGTLQFRVNGQPTSDFRAVQAHIETLEQFQAETVATGRTDFVAALAGNGRIAATQIDGLNALVQTMTDAQFNAFRDSYKDAPANSLFATHGAQGGGTPDGTGNAVAEEIETLEAIVAQHKRANMPQDKIEKTNSFQRLQTLKAAQANA
jgi:hypothetical protein